MKIGLGTVQFGQDYGVSNRIGKTAFKDAEKIVARAAEAGVRILDTAPVYGDSEQVLGEILPPGHGFDIVTKTPNFPDAVLGDLHVALLERTIDESLARLHCDSIYALLVHNANDLLKSGSARLIDKLLSLRESGCVTHVGVSVYDFEQLAALPDDTPLDVVQIPVSVFDQRWLADGHLAKLSSRGIEIHARSVFLQGVMLMEPGDIPQHLSALRPHLLRYRELIDSLGFTPLQAALGFVYGLAEVDVVLCGVNTIDQLSQVLASAQPLEPQQFSSFSVDCAELVDPRRW